MPSRKLPSMIISRVWCLLRSFPLSKPNCCGKPQLMTTWRHPRSNGGRPPAPSPTPARAARTLVPVHPQPSRGVLWVPRAPPFRSFAAGVLVPRRSQRRAGYQPGQPVSGTPWMPRPDRGRVGARVAGRAVIDVASSPPAAPPTHHVYGYNRSTQGTYSGPRSTWRSTVTDAHQMRLGPWSGAGLRHVVRALSSCLTRRGPLRRMERSGSAGMGQAACMAPRNRGLETSRLRWKPTAGVISTNPGYDVLPLLYLERAAPVDHLRRWPARMKRQWPARYPVTMHPLRYRVSCTDLHRGYLGPWGRRRRR